MRTRKPNVTPTTAVPAPDPRRHPAGASAAIVVCRLAIIALVLNACAATPAAPPPVSVPITDYRMVAGKWLGTVSGLAGPRDEADAVQVTIGEDGTYDFGVYRTIGVFGGKGQFTLQDGKLTAKGERGDTTFALYERAGRRYLRGDGRLQNGTPVSVELRPAPAR